MTINLPEDARISFESSCSDDFEELVAVRIEAMRESLERIGRFDRERARQRFRDSFVEESTWHIVLDKEGRVGFFTLREEGEHLSLQHLYILPRFQGLGLGSQVLLAIFKKADREGFPIRVRALRGSESNRFYARHGFVREAEGEWDIYYVRPARSTVLS